MGVEALRERGKVFSEEWERLPAASVLMALVNKPIHRLLSSVRILQREDENVRRRNAVENRAFDVVGMPAHVDDRRKRSVRIAVHSGACVRARPTPTSRWMPRR
jgi:hypothetical protein